LRGWISQQTRRRRLERADLLGDLVVFHDAGARHDRLLMNIQTGTMLMYQIHGGLLWLRRRGIPEGRNLVSVLRSLAALGNNSVCAWDPGSD